MRLFEGRVRLLRKGMLAICLGGIERLPCTRALPQTRLLCRLLLGAVTHDMLTAAASFVPAMQLAAPDSIPGRAAAAALMRTLLRRWVL